MALKTFFPLVIDSTMLMEYDSCPMSFFRKYLQHLSKGQESTDLIAGRAFAKGLEVARKAYWNDGADPEEAISEGRDALWEDYGDHISSKPAKTVERMSTALELYFLEYPLGIDQVKPAKLEDGTYAIEYSFAHELPFQHPDIPDMNIIITGRADMLGEYAGKLWVVDEKTTGSAFTQDWGKQWDTRGQFSTYCYGLRRDNIQVAGAYIRGIYLGKTSIKFNECQSVRNEFQVQIWEHQMMLKVQQILDTYKAWKESGEHPLKYFFGAWNESCNKYFRACQFQDLCRDKNSEMWLDSQFDQYIWLPHQQQRLPLAEFIESIKAEKETTDGQ
jgi:hypothetical protein